MANFLRITSEDLASSSTASGSDNSRVAPTLRGVFPKRLSDQVSDPDYDNDCRCQCHLKPPVLNRRPEHRKFNLAKIPRAGPIRDAALGIPHECALGVNARRDNHKFKNLLLTTEVANPSWRTGEVPAPFSSFRSRSWAPERDFGGLSYCYVKVIFADMRWKSVQCLGPECFLSDFDLVYNVAGQRKMKRKTLVETEPGLYHIKDAEGFKGMDENAGAVLKAEIEAVLRLNPNARIGNTPAPRLRYVFGSGAYDPNDHSSPCSKVIERAPLSIVWSAPRKVLVVRKPDRINVLPSLDLEDTPSLMPPGHDYGKKKRKRFATITPSRPKANLIVSSRFSPIRDYFQAEDGVEFCREAVPSCTPVSRHQSRGPRRQSQRNCFNSKYVAFVERNVARKAYLRSCAASKVVLKPQDGVLKPFIKSRCVKQPFPETLIGFQHLLAKTFGRTHGYIDRSKFLIAIAYLKIMYECPSQGFVLSLHNGWLDYWQHDRSGLLVVCDGRMIEHLGTSQKLAVGSSHDSAETVSSIKAFENSLNDTLSGLTSDLEFAVTLAKRRTAQLNWWKLTAKAFLRQAQASGLKKQSATASCFARTCIPCTEPWFDKQLLGFRIKISIYGHDIFSRGNDFSRLTEDGDGLMTVRQHKRFWRGNLVMTPKGLAKVFYRKKSQSDEKWRFAIARGIGLTLSAAYIFFSQFENEEGMPDVQLEELSVKPRAEEHKVVEKPVFIETYIPIEGDSPTSDLPAPTPPAPPIPNLQPSQSVKRSKMVNGNSYLCASGPEGKSRRAEFRDIFRTDWPYRVSKEALRYMNQDLVNEGVSRSFDPTKLICNPSLEFNIYEFKRQGEPIKADHETSHLGFIDELKKKVMKEREFKDPRVGRETPGLVGRVIPEIPTVDENVKQFKRSRDSTQADVELNPGPDTPPKVSLDTDVIPDVVTDSPDPYSGLEVCYNITPLKGSWIDRNFQIHKVIGHLPKDKDWKSRPPTWISKPGLAELQNSLDQLNVARKKFTLPMVSELMKAINNFFQNSDPEYPVNSSRVSALAHYIKTRIACPKQSFGYCVDIKPVQREVCFHIAIEASVVAKNRLWWAIDGEPVVHGGDTQPLPTNQNRDNFEGYAWAGDALLHLNVRLSIIAKYGRKDGVAFQELVNNAKLANFLKEHHRFGEAARKSRFSDQKLGDCFEYLYARDPSFRGEYNTKYNIYSTSTILDDLPQDLPKAAVARCWHKLFSKSIPIDVAFNSVEFATKKQLTQIAKVVPLTEQRFHVLRNGRTLHIETGGDLTAQRVIELMTNQDALGGLFTTDKYTKEMAWEEAGVKTGWVDKDGNQIRQECFCYEEHKDLPGYDLDPGINCICTSDLTRRFVYVYLRIYYFFLSYIAIWESHMRPDVIDDPRVTSSSNDYEPGVNPKETLLIATMGTHGDKIPLRYFANLARKYGVPVHMKDYKTFSVANLETLKHGELTKLLPEYAVLSSVADLGYAKAMVPHCEIDPEYGITYRLNPSSKWIRRISYIAKGYDVKIWNYPVVEIAERLAEIHHPVWSIGSLSDCNLPRSTDGCHLLRRHLQSGLRKTGWIHGSASEDVIPIKIRDTFEKITRTDHQQAFRDYEVIHMHGGAGSVQTAIACGATPVIHDVNLDRDYHTIPAPSDFHVPSVGPFMGWLVYSGFKVNAPAFIKLAWLAQYAWSVKYHLLLRYAYNIAKAYALLTFTKRHWASLLMIFFSISVTVWKLIIQSGSASTIFQLTSSIIWQYPIFCISSNGYFSSAFLLYFMLNQYWSRMAQDLTAHKRSQTKLVFEEVTRSGVTFPFPLGHWSIYDSSTDEHFEGVYTTVDQGIGRPFKFVSRQRAPKPKRREFSVFFNMAFVREEIEKANTCEYSSTHNCITLVFKVITKRSFFWSILLGIAACCAWVSMAPPETVEWFLSYFNEGTDYKGSALYKALGFAAGVENIPFELEDVVEEKDGAKGVTNNQSSFKTNIDYNSPVSIESLVDELAVIKASFMNTGLTTLEEEDYQEAVERTFLNEVNDDKVPLTEDALLEISPIPPYVKHTWAEIVDGVHHAISIISGNRFVETMILWLRSLSIGILNFIFPVLEALSYLMNLALKESAGLFKNIFIQGCHLMDYCWGLEASKRIKTAWGLTGLYRTGMVGVKARLAANIAYSEYIGRSNFEDDYKRLVDEGREYAKRYQAFKRSNLGGPQRRPIKYSKPLMTVEEANLLGFGSNEYETDDAYERRVKQYLEQGTVQGADGVFLAEKRPELIPKSQHRYEPKYPILNADERAFAREVAEAMFDHNPEVFENCDIVPPKSVHAYVKAKYSPGTPFIKPGGFKSRQAMFDAGYDKVLQKRAIDKLEGGVYNTQFYHAFVKSQVVDVKKCLPFKEGGSNKDVRTVVSQDLFSYYMDQVVQIERNKRKNWDTYGAGIGMPLNQSMEKIYSKMANLQKKRKGRYIILDASAFDSVCKPFLFEVGGHLWDLGYKDHPSGNGKNISSVVKASYSARQNAWIIGITEEEHNNLVIAIPNSADRRKVNSANLKNLIMLEDLIDHDKFKRMNGEDKSRYISKLKLPENKTIVTWDPTLRPSKANWMGCFETGSTSDVASTFFKYQTFVYEPDDIDSMIEDVRRVAISNYRLLSNVHFKNRGGSTGGSDTSNVNTHAFKAGVIAAWSQTTGRPPKEFYNYNEIANTSDDTIWQSGGKHGLNKVEDLERFKHYCAKYGINLVMETTKDITKVEYLSKFVRTPTPTDSLHLKAWRSCKMKAINNAHKQRGLPVAASIDELNSPRFLVVQNPKAILHRRTALRYYQSKWSTWRYTSVERGAGHALNTAFVPELYEQFALEWCDDVNLLLEHHKIHRKFKLKNGAFGLQEVKQTDPRSGSQALSPRQKAFLAWLKGNMYPSYYKVIDTHMDVKKIDPEEHAKFLRKLEKGWRGYNEVVNEGVDWLFALTDSIPDEWSKKFQPSVEMLYAEKPFYTKNKIVESFVYLKMLEHNTEDEITFSEFSSKIQESPYAGACDPYHFWEQLQDKDYKEQLLRQELVKVQGLVFFISALYMLTSAAEWFLLSIPFIGAVYKLFTWTFVGLNKVYGVLNTLYWHSTGESSKEISRIMPKDPYLVSKQFCVFLVDLIPSTFGWVMTIPVLLTAALPPMLDMIGKTWFKGEEIKMSATKITNSDNPWTNYADEYVDALRKSPTGKAYVAAKTSTGKSTMFIAALYQARHRKGINKIWLVEPRKVLRDETIIPFKIASQVLKKGIVPSASVSVYILTYGHLQSRLSQIDNNRDIVLFDEFHEEQGEMILGLHSIKAPTLLLSATPLEIPSLRGSPYLAPNIDRRHKITVHKVPDSMPVVDMFQEAQNRFPELMDRALVIVPTHAHVAKTIAALTYLGAYKPSSLTARNRVVPKEGVIVATQYVQTGLDIKPPPKILIDCGKNVVFDKGRLVTPLPWTNKDVNNQRIGRVGRLQPGVVFQPESAGTGAKTVTYPSPNLFMHQVVAKHFKMTPLTAVSECICEHLPFLRVNKSKLTTLPIQKSVILIHALSLHGVRQVEWQTFYTKKMQKKTLGEDYEWVERVMNSPKWSHVPLVDWTTALYFLNMDDVTQYCFGGKLKYTLPVSAINGQWQEIERSPTESMDYEKVTVEELDSKHLAYRKQIDKFKNHLLRQSALISEENFRQTRLALECQ